MRLSVFPTVEAPRRARQKLTELSEGVEQASLADLQLVVSELLAISITHGAAEPIEVSIDFVDGEVEGVIQDHGPGSRAISRARQHGDDSLVLRIIESLVSDWGTDPAKTRIWFRMSVARVP